MNCKVDKTLKIAMGLNSPMRSKSSLPTRSEIEVIGPIQM